MRADERAEWLGLILGRHPFVLGSAAGVALHLNVRLRPLAKITAAEDEIHGALSLKLTA